MAFDHLMFADLKGQIFNCFHSLLTGKNEKGCKKEFSVFSSQFSILKFFYRIESMISR